MVRRRLSSVRSFFQSSAATFLDFAHQGAQSRLNLEAHCSRCTLHPPQTACIARIACNPCNDCNEGEPSKSHDILSSSPEASHLAEIPIDTFRRIVMFGKPNLVNQTFDGKE